MAIRFFQIGRKCAALWVVALPVALVAQLPAEVTGLRWCPGTKNCLQWDGVAGAASYTLYRGDQTTLPALLTSAADSCALRGYHMPTSGPVLAAFPPAGGLHWFLVTASNVNGEGPPGTATAGPEIVNDSGQCDARCSACPDTCYKDQPLRGPRCMVGFGCGCLDDDDCVGWGMPCSWRRCVQNRCVETGAFSFFAACPAARP